MLKKLLSDHNKSCEDRFKNGETVCTSSYIIESGEKVEIKTTYVFSSYKQDLETALEKLKNIINPDPILREELERILKEIQ